MRLSKIDEKLTVEDLELLRVFVKSCRGTILRMLRNSQSGHPGGSLSCLDFLSLLYVMRISQSGERIVVSNGHISPAVYAVLAELGYVDKQNVIDGFRRAGSVYEGHVTRHVPGVIYGTGPLGIGAAVASGMAWAGKYGEQVGGGKVAGRTAGMGTKNAGRKATQALDAYATGSAGKKVFAVIGDGESQEGEIYEMMNFAAKYALNNLVVFCDYNQVQLSDCLANIMPTNVAGHFQAAGWKVIECDGHGFESLWDALVAAYDSAKKPVLILCKTVMGKGVDFMEKEGKVCHSTWHGKAPTPEQIDSVIGQFELTSREFGLLNEFRKIVAYQPEDYSGQMGRGLKIKTGKERLYTAKDSIDCRTAYGNALLDLAELNPEIVALDADVKGCTMTRIMEEKFPARLVEVGIAEQAMVSVAGGLSVAGYVPFASTMGAFMTSRAKDQARVNDINLTNVKMVASHCGLSVGEDGPTHQAIDDMGSFLGLFHTGVIEPADPNQTDRIIRYIASTPGNFYIRMGRHKFPVILKEDGMPFYGKDYVYEYGRTDLIRGRGKSKTGVVVVATGAMVGEAVQAWEVMKGKGRAFDLVAVSSIKHFDKNLLKVLRAARKVVTMEDHCVESGLHSQLAVFMMEKGLRPEVYTGIGVRRYQLSGKPAELYRLAGIDAAGLVKVLGKL